MNSNVIREFDPETNEELASFPVNPRKTGEEVIVDGYGARSVRPVWP